MNFLIAQLYNTYKRSGAGNPEFRVRIYLLVLTYAGLLSLFIPSFDITNLFVFDGKLKINLIWLIGFSIIFLYLLNHRYKKLFNKERLMELHTKYKLKPWPSPIVYITSIITYLLVLFLGPILSVLLTGGEILGEKIHGLLR